MPKVNQIGYGESTQVKLQALDRIVSMHLAITEKVVEKYPGRHRLPYRYVELTAGRGFTPDGLRGSTLVFLDRVHSGDYHISYQAEFIERQKDNLDTLEQTVEAEAVKNHWGTPLVRYHHYDYQSAIPLLFSIVHPNELGLAFVDHSGDIPDWDTLKLISARRPKMEILIYITSTVVKRVFPYRGRKLADYMAIVGNSSFR